MRKPGTDESNVQMSDVLCDFCHRQWAAATPMVEGHQGSCICGSCLTIAFAEVVLHPSNLAAEEYTCPMCLETAADRMELKRGGEPGWPSPLNAEAVICRRCIKLAAGTLHKDAAFDWTKPTVD